MTLYLLLKNQLGTKKTSSVKSDCNPCRFFLLWSIQMLLGNWSTSRLITLPFVAHNNYGTRGCRSRGPTEPRSCRSHHKAASLVAVDRPLFRTLFGCPCDITNCSYADITKVRSFGCHCDITNSSHAYITNVRSFWYHCDITNSSHADITNVR